MFCRAGEILFSLAWAEMEYVGADKTDLANECMKKLGKAPPPPHTTAGVAQWLVGVTSSNPGIPKNISSMPS